MARNRFLPINHLVVVCLFDAANYHSVFIIIQPGTAILLVHQGSAPFLIFFYIHILAFLFNRADALFGQVWFYFIVNIIEYLQLAFVERSTEIARSTAGAFAGIQVAHKLLLNYIVTYCFVVYYYHA